MAIESGSSGGSVGSGGASTASPSTGGGGATTAQIGSRGPIRGDTRAPAGTFDTYRKMRASPTVAIARAVAMSAIKAADWTYEGKDGVPDDRIAFIREELERHKRKLLNEGLRSLDYGFQTVVIDWSIDNAGRSVVGRLSPKLPEDVTIQVYEHTRDFAGIKVKGGQSFEPDQVCLFTYDAEADGLYGRSRMENIREFAWKPGQTLVGRIGNYVDKTAGIIPMVTYPEGEARDANGQVKSNFEIAVKILEMMTSGKGIAMPNTFPQWAEDLIRNGGDPEQLASWKISFVETGSGHGAEFLSLLQHFESLQMRGWLVPERTAIEGSRGTLAEAEQHADVALSVAQEDAEWIAEQVNHQVVNPLLIQNYGNAAKDSVRIKVSPIVSEGKAFIREMVKTILTNPANIDTFEAVADLDAMMDQAGVPKVQQVVDANEPALPATKDTGKKLARFLRKAMGDRED